MERQPGVSTTLCFIHHGLLRLTTTSPKSSRIPPWSIRIGHLSYGLIIWGCTLPGIYVVLFAPTKHQQVAPPNHQHIFSHRHFS
jgi:hypothetical protein